MIVDKDYRQGLSAEELVSTLQSLLAAERTAMRLTCRYLADLADNMDNMENAEGALIGFADVYHAAECLFGLGAHSTRERIRVGRALRSLPQIEEALVSGELSYSRAREVTRVATPDDESAWLDLAHTLPMRTLERRVVEATGKESPARTEGPAQLRWSTPESVEVTLRLPAEVWALLQRAMEGARRAAEGSLSDAEALAAVARDALEQQNTGADTTDPRHTVVLYECTTHHALLHDGRLRIEGDAEGDLVFRDGTGASLSSPAGSHVGTARVGTAAAPVASHVGTAAVGTGAVGTGAVGTGAVGTGSAAVAGAGVEAATLLALMGGRGGWSLDALVDASGLHVGAVQGALLGLEVDGLVSFDLLGTYAPCTALDRILPEPGGSGSRHRRGYSLENTSR